jgi:hypothetical protein
MFKNINSEVKYASLCETSRCLVGDMWDNNESDSVIVVIVAVVPLVIDDHIMQDDASMYNQPESTLRVRPVRDD